jgi:predicted membrane channel-forming protein YqfA (hemolysin III family)
MKIHFVPWLLLLVNICGNKTSNLHLVACTSFSIYDISLLKYCWCSSLFYFLWISSSLIQRKTCSGADNPEVVFTCVLMPLKTEFGQ